MKPDIPQNQLSIDIDLPLFDNRPGVDILQLGLLGELGLMACVAAV
jgi:hypothetical protein